MTRGQCCADDYPCPERGTKKKPKHCRIVCRAHSDNYADEDLQYLYLTSNKLLCEDCINDPCNPANNERGGL